jgi:hypothetical protein
LLLILLLGLLCVGFADADDAGLAGVAGLTDAAGLEGGGMRSLSS